MRWKGKRTPRDGAKRTIEGFLIFPKKVGGEWRWLEWARIRQEYQVTGVHSYVARWVDLYWND